MNNYKTYLDVIRHRAFADETAEKGITFIQSASEVNSLSYRQLFDLSLKTLKSFQEKGFKQGDTLVLFLNDNQQFLQAFWACLLGGIVPVPVAVGISDEHRAKLLKIVKRFDNPWLWVDEKSAQLLWRYVDEQDLDGEYRSLKSQTLLCDRFVVSEELADPAELDEDDVAFIQFSSGSTRDPKGVVLTHKNLITTNVAIGERYAYTEADSSLSWMPLTHDMGLIGFHLNMLVFGMSQALMPTDMFSRRPLLWLKKASELGSTVLNSPNFGFKHALKLYDKKSMADDELDLSAVRVISNGAEPISIALCHEFNEKMARHGLSSTAILPSYGLAEAALAVCLWPAGKAFEAVSVKRDNLLAGSPVVFVEPESEGAVSFAVEGKPVRDCQVRIGDSNGHDLGEGVVGEILIKGLNVTSGYYKEEAANANLFTADGFLGTGDLGFLHKGELVVTGRLKDIIFVSGQNYYPHDLENMVLELPDMELGKVVACGARPNDASEDDILVCILYRGDVQEFVGIAQEVKSHINAYAGIEVSHVLPVQRIPKTTSGKVQRRFFVGAYLQGDFDDVIADLNAYSNEVTESDFSSENYDKYQLLIANSCENTLPEKQLGLEDNFFDIGMSSLEMAQIHEQIETAYPGMVDIMDVFDHPSIKALSAFLASKDDS